MLLVFSSNAAGPFSRGHDVCCLMTGKSSSIYGSYPILLKCWLCLKLCQKRFVFFFCVPEWKLAVFFCLTLKRINFRERFLFLPGTNNWHLLTAPNISACFIIISLGPHYFMSSVSPWSLMNTNWSFQHSLLILNFLPNPSRKPRPDALKLMRGYHP